MLHWREMHRRHFLEALPVVATLAAGCAMKEPARSLRVLSWNLHHGEGMDRVVDLERIARVIRESGADLVALQEVDVRTVRTGQVDQAEEYQRLTGLRGAFGKAIDFQGGAYGGLLLSRWPLEAFTVHRLPNPRNREQRIALSAGVTIPGFGDVRFVGVHLDATRTDEDRWEQGAALESLFGGGTVPAILAGDLNDRPESRTVRRLLERWEDAAGGNPEPTIPADQPEARIDYVLLRPPGRWRVQSVRVLPESLASDHRPVMVTLE